MIHLVEVDLQVHMLLWGKLPFHFLPNIMTVVWNREVVVGFLEYEKLIITEVGQEFAYDMQ